MPTRIEWSDETVNPLGHGCYGPGGTKEKPKICPYCYAALMAKRNMRNCELCRKFVPHQHFEQLEKLSKWRKPRKIFMQSMGDLFHAEIPDEWIEDVFKACEAAPQHVYLFLTKNPKRYLSLAENGKLPENENWWYGSTAVRDDVEIFFSGHHNTFVSIEPILSKFDTRRIDDGLYCSHDWAIVGAETGTRKCKVVPEREWIEAIVSDCESSAIPVFLKNNLASVWGSPLIQEFPEKMTAWIQGGSE